MTAKTGLMKIARAVIGLGVSVSNTFAEQAQTITRTCRDVWGKVNWDLPADDVQTIVNAVTHESAWKGTSSEKARKSEIAAIVKAYPFLGTAAKIFRTTYGELRREHLVKIARLCPESETALDAGLLAVEYFEARDQKRGKPGSRPATIGMGLGIIKNTDTVPKGLTKAKLNAFRRDLKALCDQYGITY